MVDELIVRACAARDRALATFSGFRVGAALRTKAGKIYDGCNIENASYALTICAERVALFKALSEGEREFSEIVVVTDTEQPTPPCGPCRQLLWEYCGDLQIRMRSLRGPELTRQLADLF